MTRISNVIAGTVRELLVEFVAIGLHGYLIPELWVEFVAKGLHGDLIRELWVEFCYKRLPHISNTGTCTIQDCMVSFTHRERKI